MLVRNPAKLEMLPSNVVLSSVTKGNVREEKDIETALKASRVGRLDGE